MKFCGLISKIEKQIHMNSSEAAIARNQEIDRLYSSNGVSLEGNKE